MLLGRHMEICPRLLFWKISMAYLSHECQAFQKCQLNIKSHILDCSMRKSAVTWLCAGSRRVLIRLMQYTRNRTTLDGGVYTILTAGTFNTFVSLTFTRVVQCNYRLFGARSFLVSVICGNSCSFFQKVSKRYLEVGGDIWWYLASDRLRNSSFNSQEQLARYSMISAERLRVYEGLRQGLLRKKHKP